MGVIGWMPFAVGRPETLRHSLAAEELLYTAAVGLFPMTARSFVTFRPSLAPLL